MIRDINNKEIKKGDTIYFKNDEGRKLLEVLEDEEKRLGFRYKDRAPEWSHDFYLIVPKVDNLKTFVKVED